jgi:hypothetical protein
VALGWIYQGQTRPAWEFTVIYDDNTAYNLTNSTFLGGTMRERNTLSTITMTVGSFALTSATGGKFTYSPVAADTTVAGYYDLIVGWEQSGEPYYIGEEIEIRSRF